MGNLDETQKFIQADTKVEEMQACFQNVTVVTGGHHTHKGEVKCQKLERIAREKGAKLVHYYLDENMHLYKITYAPLSGEVTVICAIDLLEPETKSVLLQLPDIVIEYTA
ncbi:hypothetical protein ACXYMU_04765 [Pontibacter sp. CAU 1760]